MLAFCYESAPWYQCAPSRQERSRSPVTPIALSGFFVK